MPIRTVQSGFIYIMATEFGTDQVISISKSRHDPHDLANKANQANKYGLGALSSAEILYSKELPNCREVESLIHQFLIHNDYCAVTAKDYQIHFEDGIKLIETAILKSCLEPELVLELKHTKCLPIETTDYFRLASIFDGSCEESANDFLEPFHIDYEASFNCLYKGYEIGDDRCISGLARCYEDGIGIEFNNKKALKLYEEIYQLDKFKGIENMFRIFLKEKNDYRASALLIDFFAHCEKEIIEENVSIDDHMSDCLEVHTSFVRTLGSFVWESYYLCENFEVLIPFLHYFKDFKHSLFQRLENDGKLLEDQMFYELSDKINKCSDSFKVFLEKGHQSAA
ncbi:MAG: SEL1-like repeat protein [Bacteriovoracaceae bacterium]|jgi:hypothetical protein|nr:SEL1-like repeat protein [Bacteriovoracaceae bacterium]